MTAEQKAKEIYNKFYGIPLYIKTIKQCCHIAVDEIINLEYNMLEYYGNLSSTEYWQEVKQEIEKL